MPDGSMFLQLPPVANPELATMEGMAAPTPRDAVQAFDAITPQAMADTSGPGPTALLQPAAWAYDFDPSIGISRASYIGEVVSLTAAPGTATTQLATTAFVSAAITASTTGVATWNGRSGAVTMTLADVTTAGGAPAASPTFSGVANAVTAAPGTNTTQLATTMFVQAALGTVTGAMVASFNGRIGAVTLGGGDITGAGGALLNSPALVGNPTAPTVATSDMSTTLATTAFVKNALGLTVTSFNGRTGIVSLQLTDVTSVGGAPLNSPSMTGVPSAPTATAGTATTQLATTAFVTNAITGATVGVQSFNTRTGAVTLQTADIASAGGALLVSPALTGTPTAPTAGSGNQSGQLATTQFVANAITAQGGVTSWNTRTGAVVLTLTDVTGVGGAPNASPSFSGNPTGPNPGVGDNSQSLATTAFVRSIASSTTPAMNAAAAVGVGTTWARSDHVHPVDTSRYAAANPSNYQTAAQVTATVNGAVAGYLPLGGGTITGTLTVNSNVVASNFYSNVGNLILGPSGNSNSPTLTMSSAGNLNIWALSGANLVSLHLNANNTYANGGLVISGTCAPAYDNGYANGYSGMAWSNVYAYYFGTSSDIKHKTAIQALPDCLAILNTLEPKRFKWTNAAEGDPFADDTHWGFIAQDVQAALAEHEFGGHRVEASGDQSISYPELTAVLWKAVQELSARITPASLPTSAEDATADAALIAAAEGMADTIDTLTERVEALEARVRDLEAEGEAP